MPVPSCIPYGALIILFTPLGINAVISSFVEPVGNDKPIFICEFIFSDGILTGKIILSPRGNNGFGYDSIFEVEGKTLAEMTLEEKSQISHRKIATVKLVKLLNEI